MVLYFFAAAAVFAASCRFFALAIEKNGGTALSAAPDSAATSTESGITREDLLSQIEEKNRRLEEIDKNLETSKQNLEETQKQKQTLRRDLGILKNTINQLDLNIRSDRLKIQKTDLEIESLGYDIKAIQSSIRDGRRAIGRLLVEIQKNDRLSNGLLPFFLRNASLAEGFFDVQSLGNVQNELAAGIENLIKLHEEYNIRLTETNDKKGELSYHKENLEQRKFIVEDQKEARQTLLARTKNREDVYQKQIADLEKLKEDVVSEIEAIGAILRTKIDPATLPAPKPGVLEFPVSGGKESITQGYGATHFARQNYRGKWHNGIDIGVPVGTPILAAEDGEVAATGNQDKFCYRAGYGKFIVVNHKNNLTTLYGHLSRVIVEKGQAVKRGDVIGYSGKSGWATGPHLHFTVFALPTFYMSPSKACKSMPVGGDLNPMGYL